MYEILYRSRLGRKLAETMARPGISRAAGRFMDSRFSSLMIAPFKRMNHISMDDVLPENYKSFNAFFTRNLKPGTRPIIMEKNVLASPCDAYLTALPISPEGIFTVKGTPYTLETLTESKALAREYNGGWCLIFRLTPTHYHHYAFPDDGVIGESRRINGVFHTVRPEALASLPVFKTNTREYTVLETAHFGRMIYMEVGATMVGRIVNKVTSGAFKRGSEKGMFEFGGSTVILLTAPGALVPDKAFIEASRRGEEIDVRLGQAIGRRE